MVPSASLPAHSLTLVPAIFWKYGQNLIDIGTPYELPNSLKVKRGQPLSPHFGAFWEVPHLSRWGIQGAEDILGMCPAYVLEKHILRRGVCVRGCVVCVGVR